MLNRTRQHAKVAADQTQNSHKSNLRDDLDQRFDLLEALVRNLALDLGGMKHDIRTIHDDLGQTRVELAAERERIRKLETTQPKDKR